MDRHKPVNTSPKVKLVFHHKRVQLLKEIETQFAASESTEARIVLHGCPGAGKTQLALDYAQAASRDRDVFWIRADCWSNVIHDYGHLLKTIKPRETLPENPAILIPRVRTLLEEYGSRKWLLVLDDFCSEPEPDNDNTRMLVMCNSLPRHPNGNLLFCVRDRSNIVLNRLNIVPKNNFIEVGCFSVLESMAFVRDNLPPRLDGVTATNSLLTQIRPPDSLPLVIAHRLARARKQMLGLGQREFSSVGSGSDCDAAKEHPLDMRSGSQTSTMFVHQFSGPDFEPPNESAALLLSTLCLFRRQRIPEYLARPVFDKLNTSNVGFDKALADLEELALVNLDDEVDEYEIPSVVRSSALATISASSTVRILNAIISLVSKRFPGPKSISIYPDLREAWDSQTYLLSLGCGIVESARQNDISTLESARLLFKIGTGMYHLHLAHVAAQYLQQSLDTLTLLNAERTARLPVIKYALLADSMTQDLPAISKLAQEYFNGGPMSELELESLQYIFPMTALALKLKGDHDRAKSLVERFVSFVASHTELSDEERSQFLYLVENISHIEPGETSSRTAESLLAVIDPATSSHDCLRHLILLSGDQDAIDEAINNIFGHPKRGLWQNHYVTLASLLEYLKNVDKMDYEQSTRVRMLGERLLEKMPPYMTPTQITVHCHLTDLLGNTCLCDGDWADAEGYFTRSLNDLMLAQSLGYSLTEGELDQSAFNVALTLCLQDKTRELQTFGTEQAESLARMAADPDDPKDFKKDAMLFFLTDAVRKAKRSGETDAYAAMHRALQEKLEEWGSREEE